jgi:hypothetical protein
MSILDNGVKGLERNLIPIPILTSTVTFIPIPIPILTSTVTVTFIPILVAVAIDRRYRSSAGDRRGRGSRAMRRWPW